MAHRSTHRISARLPALLCALTVVLGGNAGAQGRIVAFGDVHGGFGELTALLEALELVDGSGNWVGGDAHLVSLGDLLDRGPDSRQVMDLLMRLEAQAPESGGRVSLVLGNHEVMNLTGDLRYVAAEEYAAFDDEEDPAERAAELATFVAANPLLEDAADVFAAHHPPGFFGHRRAFAADGHYGRWLLSKPQILVVDGTAFVHGGLSTHFASEPIDTYNLRAAAELSELLETGASLRRQGILPRWDDLVSAEPTTADTLIPDALSTLRGSVNFASTGPTWYRGTASCHPLIERTRFERVLQAQGLQRIIMGHTPTVPRIIQTRFDGRAVLADTGMFAGYYDGLPSAVVIDGDNLTALTLDRDGILAPRLGSTAEDQRAGDEAELLQALRQAAEAGAIRPDQPIRVTLEGREYLATARRDSRRERGHRLAAFALDKHLGLGLVAPITATTVDGRPATLEAQPARAVNEIERVERNLQRPSWCGSIGDYQLMYALDALIGNDGRTAASILYAIPSWLMYLGGHETAFPTASRLPGYLEGAPVALPVALKDALARLEPDGLEDLLGDYLTGRQIRALIERRDVMLETWPVEE